MGDLVVALQELNDGTGVLAVAVHPHGERLETPQREVVVEG